MTNGDKVRSMDDDELAKAIYNNFNIAKSEWCLACKYRVEQCKESPCPSGIEDWLESEVE